MDSLEVSEVMPLTPTGEDTSTQQTPFGKALVAGGLAGMSVDIALFPIDTVKTRLQSPRGFLEAGGFRGIYRGVGAVMIGSCPGAALFFSVYETMKPRAYDYQKRLGLRPDSPAFSHMFAASAGECAACLVRVPTEVVKSKMQTNERGAQTVSSTLRKVLSEEGPLPMLGGLYRGFGITLMREIPFALIQFPIYEWAKVRWSRYQGAMVSPLQAAACGSFGGAIAAALTTPLDLVKTRLMLGRDRDGKLYTSALDVVKRVWTTEGPKTLFSGIQPRVFWISLGGFVFFGSYESVKAIIII